jgi:hypothetical protein
MIDAHGAMTGHRAKCMTLYVQSVERKPRSRSNQMVRDPYTAGIVTRRIDRRDGISRYIQI